MDRARLQAPRSWPKPCGGSDVPNRTCSIDGCLKPLKATGLCGMHHERKRRHGDPHHVGYIQGDDVARFWSKVDKNGPGGCWLWTGHRLAGGYGAISISAKSTLAHRYSYELNVGPIPEGLTIDHVYERGCRHRHCVNPAHLEPVTAAENGRRARYVQMLTA